MPTTNLPEKWSGIASLGELGYVSPSMAKIDGEDQLIMITASNGGFGGDARNQVMLLVLIRKMAMCSGPIQTGVVGFLHQAHMMPVKTRS